MTIEHKSLIIKNYEGETEEFSELLDKLEKKHICNRYYCYFCLKGNYDTLAENIKDNNSWLCPYCTGACYCTRCMRNEKILQLIGYYYSINGDINYLHDQLINMNSIIDELFTYTTMNNIYLILYDKNLTPAQMVNNFKNYDANKYDDILNKEDEIKNLKDYIQILNKQKEEIHNEFATFCKDKFEVKQKYNIISGNNINDDDINDDIDMNIHSFSFFEKEEINHKNNIKQKEKEENYLKYKNEENESSEETYKDKNNGVHTRKKTKIFYFQDKYYSRKKEKKNARKSLPKNIDKNKLNKYIIKK